MTDQEIKESLQDICQRLDHIVEDIHDFSRRLSTWEERGERLWNIKESASKLTNLGRGRGRHAAAGSTRASA